MSQQPSQQRSVPSRPAGGTPDKQEPAERRSLPTTAAILSKGVSLGQVLQAVRRLKPQISQRG